MISDKPTEKEILEIAFVTKKYAELSVSLAETFFPWIISHGLNNYFCYFMALAVPNEDLDIFLNSIKNQIKEIKEEKNGVTK